MQSGTIYSPVGRLIENPKDYAHRLSEMLGNNTKDPEATVEFLRSIDIHNLIEAQKKLKTNEVHCSFSILCERQNDLTFKAYKLYINIPY